MTQQQLRQKSMHFIYFIIELHALYSSPNIIRNLKLKQLRWAGHVARMDKPEEHAEF